MLMEALQNLARKAKNDDGGGKKRMVGDQLVGHISISISIEED